MATEELPTQEEAGYRDVTELATYCNISPRRVQQLADDGVMPKASRGRYHFLKAVRGYILYLQRRNEGRMPDNLQEQRVRLTQLQSRELELRIAKAEGTLVPVEEIEPTWVAFVAAARSQLRAEPDRLAATLAVCDDVAEIRSILSESFNEFLRNLAGYEPAGDPSAAAPGGVEAGAAAEDDGSAVGRDLSLSGA